jgi:hypothetical protein
MFLLQAKPLWETILENSAVPLALLGVVAYFIKRFFDLRSKKVEIRYTLFHQNKLKYMIEFQAAYFDLEKTVFNYTKEVIKETIDIGRLRNALLPKLDKFNSAHENVRFFVSEFQRQYFDRMSKNLSHFVYNLIDFNYERSRWNSDELKQKIDGLTQYKKLIRKMIKENMENIFDTYRQELERDARRDRQLLRAIQQSTNRKLDVPQSNPPAK